MFRIQRNGRLGARYGAKSVLITKEHGAISFLLLVPFGYSVKTTSAVCKDNAPYADSRVFTILPA
ncbi:hypothetical protein VspSTUT11_44050 [Vibrio sp. STUT-A11]|nr:hypothetical protein [Vibrio parahaemolyticus]BDR16429.1 hypothetical protein VspSTUT11_44050 [Vibrio sp. STUT-A11]